VVPAEAIPELAGELRLTPGSTLLDLACGRGAYGLLIAQKAGTHLIGVDFSAQALTEAREQAARMGVSNASFRDGELTAAGLPGASVEAVICTDAIQFPDEPACAYDEIRRVLKPGGRVVLSRWTAMMSGSLSGYAAQTSGPASTRRASRTLRSATARRGSHASTRCGKRPSRLPLATTLRCALFTQRA